MTNSHSFTDKLLKELKSALNKFGTYSFDDKGPEEVMDIEKLVQEYQSLPQKNKIEVAQEVKKEDHRANTVLTQILSAVEKKISTTEFQEILKVSHDDVKDWFNP